MHVKDAIGTEQNVTL